MSGVLLSTASGGGGVGPHGTGGESEAQEACIVCAWLPHYVRHSELSGLVVSVSIHLSCHPPSVLHEEFEEHNCDSA